jgi:hypothetical protein
MVGFMIGVLWSGERVLEEMCEEMFVEYGIDFTMSVVPTPLTFFEMGEELFLSDAVSGRSRGERARGEGRGAVKGTKVRRWEGGKVGRGEMGDGRWEMGDWQLKVRRWEGRGSRGERARGAVMNLELMNCLPGRCFASVASGT